MKMKFLPLIAIGAFLASTAAAAPYNITPDNSKVAFKIQNKPPGRNAFEEVPGSFKEFNGSMTLDGASASVQMEVKTASVDTANERRDAHLRNQDFFKVKEFPTMSFKSTSVKKTGADAYEVKGDFTLLGKTHPITVQFKSTAPNTGTASFRIKRSDYGMTYRVPDTADEVDVILSIGRVTE